LIIYRDYANSGKFVESDNRYNEAFKMIT